MTSSVNQKTKQTNIDLGDELLAQIMAVVQTSSLPAHRKAKSLARAGKIGEMYLGQFADECGDAALNPSL